MSRVIELEGKTHEFPDDATDAEIAQALGGNSAPAPAPAESFGQKVNDFANGVGEGAFSIPQNAVTIGARATDAMGLTHGGEAAVKGANAEANSRVLQEQNVNTEGLPFKIGRPVGQVAAAAPLAAAIPESLPGVLAGNALTGGLTADPDHAGTGALLGMMIGAPLQAAGHAIAPVISGAVQRLAEQGVTMTPGQIFGGWAKGLEDRASGFWPLDGWIKDAQRNSLRTFGNGAGNIAMGGIGPIPPGISGQAMSTTGHQLFDNAYGQVLPQLDVTLGHDFANSVNGATDTVNARLPDTNGEQFMSTLADVFKKLNSGQAAPTNVFPGQAAKDAYSDLGFLSREYQGPNASPNDSAMGRGYGDVQEAFRNAFSNSDPWAAGALENIDNAYRNFIPVDKAVKSASGNGGGLEAGVFTPGQLRQAVVGSDNSVRKVASSEGGGPLQQYAEDGIQVLPSSIGSSGTGERVGLFALPALAASMIAHPGAAAAAATVPALYSRVGLNLVNRLYAHGASPGATALGNMVQQLGRYGAGPAGGALTEGGQ